MISLSQNQLIHKVLLLLTVSFFPLVLNAQDGQGLSISPALFEMAATRDQAWQSSLRVVNPNPFPLTVYADVVNFAPRGEGGDGMFLPPESSGDGSTLAEWITLGETTVTIPAERTFDIPFSLNVPSDAAPGGHFAAFTVSTRPPESVAGATALRTAQVVSSLFFVRVAGEVREEAAVREFRSEQRFLTRPEVTFSLRVENLGNVHVRPQGDITITNMWGQERGVVPINRYSHFGNVLPDSIRKFSFSWRGEWSLSDIGRYKAIVTLAYGESERRFITSTTYFWVVPVVPVTVALAVIIGLVAILVFLIRLYVRHLLAAAGVSSRVRQPYVRTASVAATTRRDLVLEPAVTDVTSPASTLSAVLRTSRNFVQETLMWLWRLSCSTWFLLRTSPKRRRLYVLLGTAGVLSLISGFFVKGALTPQRSYEVVYDTNHNERVVSSDAIIFETERTTAGGLPRDLTTPTLAVVNRSGVAGLGATVALMLEVQGYVVSEVRTELGTENGRTVIVYSEEDTETALSLSAELKNALLSSTTNTATSSAAITVYLGSDMADLATE